jgi:hypothetical protein
MTEQHRFAINNDQELDDFEQLRIAIIKPIDFPKMPIYVEVRKSIVQ